MRRGAEACGASRLTLFLVTGNPHKLAEAREVARSLGAPVRIEAARAGKLEVQSDSLEEIALSAARSAFEEIRRPLLVDDSGLFIEALNGFPGPYSSYVYRTLGITGILRLLEGETNRRACFRTALALILPPYERVFTGETCGTITRAPRGTGGFGFDPIFIPEGHTKTYAEMGPLKNAVSHRYKAFKNALDYLRDLLPPS